MNLNTTNGFSVQKQLLKKIKTLLLLSVFSISSMNVFAQAPTTISACGDFVSGPSMAICSC